VSFGESAGTPGRSVVFFFISFLFHSVARARADKRHTSPLKIIDFDAQKSMDDTMKSLDDLLPPPPKPKREFPDSFYDDDPSSSKPPPAKTSGGVSKEMRAKLLNESVGLGGVPGKAMPSNLFANIILFVLALVVVAYVGGIRP
jgi:hypothetical protein